MRIGIIDVDGHSGFPNLALMKLSAYHKARGDEVTTDTLGHFGRVYQSKVFTFSSDIDTIIDADGVVRAGTGYKDYTTELAPAVAACFPDYSLYPQADYAVGFLTRGCIRNCPWCVVPKKEGRIRPENAWHEIKRSDSRDMLLLDNNVLASDWGIEQIGKMTVENVRVDFNQGLDARLITPEIARLLAGLKWIRHVRISCDTVEMLPIIERTVAYLREAGVATWRLWCYALVTDVDEAHRRVLALDAMGVLPFAQPYRDFDGGEPTAEQRRFARWVNMRAAFKSCAWEDYNMSKKRRITNDNSNRF